MEEGDEPGGVSGAQEVGDLGQCEATPEKDILQVWLMERRKLGGDGSDFFHPLANKLGDEISTADGCPQEFYATSLDLLDAAAIIW